VTPWFTKPNQTHRYIYLFRTSLSLLYISLQHISHFTFSFLFYSPLTSMVPGPLLLQTTTSSPTQSPHDGGPRSLPIPRRHISTVPRLPLRHCPPLDHNLQPQRHLLLLLPLGQVTLFSPISLSSTRYTLPHPIPTLHGNFFIFIHTYNFISTQP